MNHHRRGPLMTGPDRALTANINRRARPSTAEPPLRRVNLHRLRDADKAVGRVGLREDLHMADVKRNVYCEPCDRWHTTAGFAEEWSCPGCDAWYVAEMVVYTRLRDSDDTENPLHTVTDCYAL